VRSGRGRERTEENGIGDHKMQRIFAMMRLFGSSVSLAYAAQDYTEDLDARIERHAKGWTVERIAPLERAIMRIALLEMVHPDAAPGDAPIPPEGAISEAVETAKQFCGAEAPGFVNGILAAALREMGENGAYR